MEWTMVVELEENLWAINEMDRTIMYLINGIEKALLIDTGLGITDLHGILYDLCGDKSVYVVNTHAHGDHNSGNCQFSCVYVGRFDEVYSHKPMSLEERKLSKRLYFQDAMRQGYDFNQWAPGPTEEVRTVRDGDVFDLGGYQLQVLEIPSHTLGSIALLEENQGWIFTGDVVLTWEVWGHLTYCMLAPSASLSNYYQSLIKLSQYKDKIRCVFPSHGRPEENREGYSQYRLPVSILDVYRDGVKSILEGTAEVKDYSGNVENGKVAKFSVGGIVFQETRMK